MTSRSCSVLGLIGAPYHDDHGSDSGSAYVFDLGLPIDGDAGPGSLADRYTLDGLARFLADWEADADDWSAHSSSAGVPRRDSVTTGDHAGGLDSARDSQPVGVKPGQPATSIDSDPPQSAGN